MKAPFPYFGGKSKVTDLVWQRFGWVQNYVEPFAGSAIMMLANPNEGCTEVINDLNALLINFWRAVQKDPQGVAFHADAPSSEVELQSRHNYIYTHREAVEACLRLDPDYCNARVAGWWLYCMCSMVGGRGIFQEMIGGRVPRLGKRPGIYSGNQGDIQDVIQALSERLKYTMITSGDWRRVLNTVPLRLNGTPAAVFFDPPYDSGEWYDGAYEHHGTTDGEPSVFSAVREWCIEHGNDPELRIALCGYDSCAMPDDWEKYQWTATGGWSALGNGETRGKLNRHRETIWFSPHCNKPEQPSLFK